MAEEKKKKTGAELIMESFNRATGVQSFLPPSSRPLSPDDAEAARRKKKDEEVRRRVSAAEYMKNRGR
jgi:hypothetical protein